MDREAARVWRDPDAPALCLLTLGIDRNLETVGRRLLCLNWTPQTWLDEIAADIGEPPHPRAFSRFSAALGLLHNPDEFYMSVPGFSDICMGLASDWFDTTIDHIMTADEMVRGLVEAYLISPPSTDERFLPAVNRFANWVARNDGFSKMPDAIKAFGLSTDPGFDWGHDLSGDPDLAGIAAQGDDDRQQEFASALRDYLYDLAGRLESLPLRKLQARGVAGDIRARIPAIPDE